MLLFDINYFGNVFFQDPATLIMENIIDLHNDIMYCLIFLMLGVFWFLIRLNYLFFFRKDKEVRELFFFRGIVDVPPYVEGNTDWVKKEKTIKPTDLNHFSEMEFIWTLAPCIVLVHIAIPSFSLLYSMQPLTTSNYYLKIIGHQWWWKYEGTLEEFVFYPKYYLFKKEELKDYLSDIRKIFLDNYQPFRPTENHMKSILDLHLNKGLKKKYSEALDELKCKFIEIQNEIDLLKEDIEITKNTLTEEERLKVRQKLEEDLLNEFNNPCVSLLHSVSEYYFDPSEWDWFLASERVLASRESESIAGWTLWTDWTELTDQFFRSYKESRYCTSLLDYNWDQSEELINFYKKYLKTKGSFSFIKSFQVRKDFSENRLVDFEDLNKGEDRLLQTSTSFSIPINTQITVLVTSSDVLHSWAVPSLGVKIDACPGRLNEMNFKVYREGYFYGQCSEICGILHGFMPISLYTFNVCKV